MGIKYKAGDRVAQVMPAPLVGPIVQVAIVDGDVKYLVEVGQDDLRWFSEHELEAVK